MNTTSEPKPVGLDSLKPPLCFYGTMSLHVEKMRVATEVRQSHLLRNGTTDPHTQGVHELLVPLESHIDNALRFCLKEHPASSWLHGIKGLWSSRTDLPLEPLGKLLGEIENFGRWYPAGDGRIPNAIPSQNLTRELHRAIESGVRVTYTDDEGTQWQWVSGIERLTTVSKLWTYAGYAPSQHRTKGELASYNTTLKTMCFRVAQYGCIMPSNRYKSLLDTYKQRKTLELTAQGVTIRGTPKGRWCGTCEKSVVLKAGNYCPDCGNKLERKSESEGVMFQGHLHNMGVRYMMKMFLCHLHTVWRTELGLPVRPPYVVEKLGHETVIDPWSMCDDAMTNE